LIIDLDIEWKFLELVRTEYESELEGELMVMDGTAELEGGMRRR
jgi:hypothetical protein